MKGLTITLQNDINKMVPKARHYQISKFNICFTYEQGFMFSFCILSTKYSHFFQQPHLHNHLVQLRHHLHHTHPSALKLNNHLVLDQTQYLLHRHLRSNTIIMIIYLYSKRNTESSHPHTPRFLQHYKSFLWKQKSIKYTNMHYKYTWNENWHRSRGTQTSNGNQYK